MSQLSRETPTAGATSSSRDLRSLGKKLIETKRRCHLSGSFACAMLIGATVWVCSNPEGMLSQTPGLKSDLNDAIQLLEEADTWREKYVSLAKETDSLNQRKLAIKQWLPSLADWTKIDRGIRGVAAIQGVEIVALRQIDKHVGTRVGVVQCECRITGDFQSICEMMQRLSMQSANNSIDRLPSQPIDAVWPYPVWCHQIQIQRLPMLVDGQIQCAAMLWIRVPYAAEGSAAADIFKQEPSDAS